MSDYTNRLLAFLSQSPTPYHAVKNTKEVLEANGYSLLDESEPWEITRPGKYYITRNDSSLIAFSLNNPELDSGFRLVGAHTDSPCLKVKPEAISVSEGYARLAVETYGGVLLNPWFDRDLSMAGRISLLDSEGQIQNKLINFDHPIAIIPSLAIHLNRDVNDKHSINKQKHLPAVLCCVNEKTPDFKALLKSQLQVEYPALSIEKILGYELSLYDHQAASLVGLEKNFIASARLDNLLSCFAGLEAIVNADDKANQLLVLNDHEEVGSGSTSGAQGPFLLSVLKRLCQSEENLQRALSRSMLISADNAHAVHPNYADRHEPAHKPAMNAGPVIKINHNQRYATNSETEAVFRHICDAENIPIQAVVVRSDMGCGSTIGPITATLLGVRTIDIGVPQLAMHSIREMAGAEDQDLLVSALRGFYEFTELPF